MVDEHTQKPYGHTDVAPIDGGIVNTNSKGERVAHRDGSGEGVVPSAADQPTFPRAMGVDYDDEADEAEEPAQVPQA